MSQHIFLLNRMFDSSEYSVIITKPNSLSIPVQWIFVMLIYCDGNCILDIYLLSTIHLNFKLTFDEFLDFRFVVLMTSVETQNVCVSEISKQRDTISNISFTDSLEFYSDHMYWMAFAPTCCQPWKLILALDTCPCAGCIPQLDLDFLLCLLSFLRLIKHIQFGLVMNTIKGCLTLFPL